MQEFGDSSGSDNNLHLKILIVVIVDIIGIPCIEELVMGDAWNKCV